MAKKPVSGPRKKPRKTKLDDSAPTTQKMSIVCICPNCNHSYVDSVVVGIRPGR
jgi:hypothetical protein